MRRLWLNLGLSAGLVVCSCLTDGNDVFMVLVLLLFPLLLGVTTAQYFLL